jgi:hypothetical protein
MRPASTNDQRKGQVEVLFDGKGPGYCEEFISEGASNRHSYILQVKEIGEGGQGIEEEVVGENAHAGRDELQQEEGQQKEVVQREDPAHPANVEDLEVVWGRPIVDEDPRDEEAREDKEEVYSTPGVAKDLAKEQKAWARVCGNRDGDIVPEENEDDG